MTSYIIFYGGWFTVGWIAMHILKLAITRPKKGAEYANYSRRGK